MLSKQGIGGNHISAFQVHLASAFGLSPLKGRHGGRDRISDIVSCKKRGFCVHVLPSTRGKRQS